MAARVDIINSALVLIGGTRIIDPDENTPNANKARDIYDSLLGDQLRSHFWNFATQRVKLARLSEVPTFEFDYAYAIPADWLRTVSVSPDDAGETRIKYKMELISGQRVILASTEDLYLRYIARITDPNLWIEDFKQAMILYLASALAIPVASSRALRDTYAAEAKSKRAVARSTDAMGSTPERRPRGSWLTSRGRTGRRGITSSEIA